MSFKKELLAHVFCAPWRSCVSWACTMPRVLAANRRVCDPRGRDLAAAGDNKQNVGNRRWGLSLAGSRASSGMVVCARIRRRRPRRYGYSRLDQLQRSLRGRYWRTAVRDGLVNWMTRSRSTCRRRCYPGASRPGYKRCLTGHRTARPARGCP